MLLLLLLLRASELGHVYKTAVENDFSLWVVRRALELVGLDSALVLQRFQQVFRVVVHVSQDDALISLAISQS